MPVARRECEFFLMKYVPDPVRNEFVHVGVVLIREPDLYGPEGGPGAWLRCGLLRTGGGCGALIRRRIQGCWRISKASCGGGSGRSRREI